jgi:C-3',4' desaturase CrtD
MNGRDTGQSESRGIRGDERIVVVGAGIGGLTAAALLAKAGLDVTVLEAHIYPGGCAGTFYHQGYRFDAGATLAAGFDAGGVMARLGERLGISWPAVPAEPAFAVHLPDGSIVTRWAAAERWHDERLAAFGRSAEPFWRWQECTADLLWTAAQAGVPWPPQSLDDLIRLAKIGAHMAAKARRRLPDIAADAFRPVAAHMTGLPAPLRHYVDGQLLISAQTTSAQANALYGAAALDLSRRGVAHVRGGMGNVATLLADAVRRHGGHVHYRQRVTQVERRADASFIVETSKGASFEAGQILFNLPPWDAAGLLGETAPTALRKARLPQDGWGAFMVYVGLDTAAVPAGMPLHLQVLAREPFGEGNSVFLSLSLPDDPGRAPAGHRTLTISTHTAPAGWWELFERDRPAFEARKETYTQRVLDVATTALPGLRQAARLVLTGTPITFQRFTHRSLGWVGGFPQTSLFRARGPQIDRNLWLVGDSIFPGQSMLAVALGGERVASAMFGSGLFPFWLGRRPARAGSYTLTSPK